MQKDENDLRGRTKAFALQIVRMFHALEDDGGAGACEAVAPIQLTTFNRWAAGEC